MRASRANANIAKASSTYRIPTLKQPVNRKPEPVGDVSTFSGEAAGGTALADLLANDVPEPVAPTVPMPPDAMEAPEIPRMETPPKPLGVRYWALAILVPPAALVLGLLMPSRHRQKRLAITFPVLYMLAASAAALVLINGVRAIPSPSSENSPETVAAEEQIAVTHHTPAVPAATLGNTYEDTDLPTYAGLTFETGSQSDNELVGLIARADPSSLKTFVGHTPDEYQEVTAFFFEQFSKRALGD